jgi:hypothetical protein
MGLEAPHAVLSRGVDARSWNAGFVGTDIE